MQVPGLRYLPNFISGDEQAALVQAIDASSWRDDLQRRVQHYGYRYDYKARKIDRAMFLGALPDWLDTLNARLVSEAGFTKPPEQAIVNEYQPGQGISAHVDCVPCFGPVIASLSLLSSCSMELISKEESTSLYIEPKSLLVLSEDARYRWQHRIPARKSDNKVPRGRRISVTFRTVVL